MNQKVIVGVVIVIILLLGGGTYWYMNSQTKSSVTTGDNTATPADQQSLKDLMAANRPVKCEFNDESGTEGTVYVNDRKVRGDFTSTSGGQMTRSHMISDGDTIYIWVDDMKTGTKMTVGGIDTDNLQQAAENPGQFNFQEELGYNCGAWSVDASLFVVPSGIEFTDLNAMMPTSANANVNDSASGSAGAGTTDCSVCDSAPAEARVQCRAALGC